MYCWGSTENGELGLGAPEKEQVTLPTFSNFDETWNVKQVAAGLTHTLILTEEGQVFSCGDNEVGQLGHYRITRRPEHVDCLSSETIVQVAAGDQHSAVITSWGMLYTWGDNGFGQLGLSSYDSHIDTPKCIKYLGAKFAVQVACGACHTLALTSDGDLFSWGMNIAGQLGLGHQDGPIRTPRQVLSVVGVPIAMISAGGLHTAVLTFGGYLLTWGSNKYGQLGCTTKEEANYRSSPGLVHNLATYSEPLRFVAAGEGHTAVLDSLGKLWTFGYGRYGQLGHGSFDDTPVPRPIFDLIGSKISQVACGRCHTLIYIPSQGQVYAFGQGMSGQLGIKTPRNWNLPQAVIGPWRSSAEKCLLNTEGDNTHTYVKSIFAGGDASIVCSCKEIGRSPDYCEDNQQLQLSSIEEEKINMLLSIGENEMIEDELFTFLETAFGSLACWNRSFLTQPSSKVDHGINYLAAEESFAKLGRIKRASVVELIELGISKIMKDLPTAPLTPECCRCYVLIPLWKGFGNPQNAADLQTPYANNLLKHGATYVVFKKWLQTLPRDFMRQLVKAYKSVVAHVIKSVNANNEGGRPILLAALKMLQLLHKENTSLPSSAGRLPHEAFYIKEIAEKIDIAKDYSTWLASRSSFFPADTQMICFCEYSFLFDPLAKTILLRADASRQMQGAMQEAALMANPFHLMFNPGEVQFLNLYVHRENLVEDTIRNLLSRGDLKQPLKVHFVGEEAEDAGGVRKEFFILLLREILNPDYGMFREYPETRRIWFREGALEASEMFALIGMVCGLAIYNFTIINLPFPLALYKKLLGEPVTIADLEELDPPLTRSLHQLLEYDGSDVEDVFCLNFTVTQDFFGETQTIPLKEDGENIPVTCDNRQEYIDLLVDHRLNKGIKKQYEAFHAAFYRVCGDRVLKLFQPQELMELVTGNEIYDWSELQKNTEYKGVFYPDHQTIKMFWEVFDEMTLEQKKRFLLFLTGTDRIPILGMKAIKMTIQSTPNVTHLPAAHTCMSQLDLPTYGTKEKLRYQLLLAIQHCEGFGLV